MYQPSDFYSNAVVAGNFAFLAGVGAPRDVDDVAQATRGVLGNMGATLQGIGGAFGNVISARVFLSNITDYEAMNAAWVERFATTPPARTVIEAANPGNSLVEVELTAYLPNGATATAPAPAPAA